LLCIKNPIRGAVPDFLGPPQFGLFIIDAVLRAFFDAFINTIVINYINILFLTNKNAKIKIIQNNIKYYLYITQIEQFKTNNNILMLKMNTDKK
jgi:hypothetical protein